MTPSSPMCCTKAQASGAIYPGDVGMQSGWSDYEEHPNTKWCIIAELVDDGWEGDDGDMYSETRAIYLPIQHCPFCGASLTP